MSLIKIIKKLMGPGPQQEPIEVPDFPTKEDKCNHHPCIDRRDYHVTCTPKCGKKRHIRDVNICCECGQENYRPPYYATDSVDCKIKDDNWAVKDRQGSRL